MTLIDVALTQCRVLFQYLGVSLAPLPEHLQLVSPQVLSRSLSEPPVTLVAAVATAVLVSTGVYLLKRRPVAGFGILFYVMNLIPEALLVPQYAFFGYRAVLPMFGLCLVLADCGAALLDAVRGGKRQRTAQTALLAVSVAAMILTGMETVERAHSWSDEVRFWRETVSQFPPSTAEFEIGVEVQALANLGRALYKAAEYPEAAQWYERALRLSPGDPMTLASLGSTYAKLENPKEAEAFLRMALEICPELAYAHESLGNLLMAQNRGEEATEHLKKAAELLRSIPGQDRVCPQ